MDSKIEPVAATDSFEIAATAAWDFIRPKLIPLNKEKGLAGVWSNGFRSGWDAKAREVEAARLRTVDADNARLRSEVERLTRERDEAVAVLRLHHIMAVERGEIGLPDGDGGWIAINDGAEYCDSTLYNRTVQVIDQHPVFRPMPRGGWQQSQGWWENWLLETRMRRKAEAELTTLTARTREVLAPFAEWFPEEALRRVPPDQRLMTTGLEARHFRAANTLFNELKEKDNAGN